MLDASTHICDGHPQVGGRTKYIRPFEIEKSAQSNPLASLKHHTSLLAAFFAPLHLLGEHHRNEPANVSGTLGWLLRE
jgi:hypothetical protein